MPFVAYTSPEEESFFSFVDFEVAPLETLFPIQCEPSMFKPSENLQDWGECATLLNEQSMMAPMYFPTYVEPYMMMTPAQTEVASQPTTAISQPTTAVSQPAKAPKKPRTPTQAKKSTPTPSGTKTTRKKGVKRPNTELSIDTSDLDHGMWPMDLPPSPFPQTSMDIFMKYVGKDSQGNADASGILSKACFQEWLVSRKSELKNPYLTYVHTVRSHVTSDSKTGRMPFSEEVEKSLLALLRQKKVWPCFQDSNVRYGVRGMFVTGYHEARRAREKQEMQGPTPQAATPQEKQSNKDSDEFIEELVGLLGNQGVKAVVPAALSAKKQRT